MRFKPVLHRTQQIPTPYQLASTAGQSNVAPAVHVMRSGIMPVPPVQRLSHDRHQRSIMTVVPIAQRRGTLQGGRKNQKSHTHVIIATNPS